MALPPVLQLVAYPPYLSPPAPFKGLTARGPISDSNLMGSALVVLSIVAVLLHCGLAQTPSALAGLPFLDGHTVEDVIVLTTPPPGYEPATTDAEWEPVLRANLYDDLAKYRAKVAKASGCGVSHHVLASLAGKPSGGVQIQRICRMLAGSVQLYGLHLPDTIFELNVFDEPTCRLTRGCRLPVFSMHKRYNFTTNRSMDSDVLFPHLAHPFDRLLFYPWAAKDKHAILRASMQRPYMGMTKHAKWRYLVNADGHVSASRLGYIMQTNSVVLRQQSLWIEYYYRSLRHGEHVLEYNEKTILPMLKSYDDPTRDAELRRIANTSQHFCARYLTPEGKARYAAYALHAYAELFSAALPAFVRGLPGLLDSRSSEPNTTGTVPSGDELVRALLKAGEAEEAGAV
ncbi:KDEL motif-containing protein 2 [Tetrabaena socialis]|uniref:KDEL motif-containing protein 2 n=1 Tax=Tetrabaena socialis TaxID=47790 RepID=A0A2J8ABJ2_9CHLO|nr:KDEL motif-containing protein 2 [Tetrabaena socialis]|eukprot:PNH09843.1 KDEL motif-containing protein 2 [Tetrabaena socialis]